MRYKYCTSPYELKLRTVSPEFSLLSVAERANYSRAHTPRTGSVPKQMMSVGYEALFLPPVRGEMCYCQQNANTKLGREKCRQMTCSESNFYYDVEEFTSALQGEGLNINTFGCVLIV